MASSQEGEKAKLKLSTESITFRLHIVVFEQILEGIITESETAKNVLQDVTIEERMKQDEKSSMFLALKIELMRVKAKLKCLLEQMKSVQEVEELESKILQMRLGVNVKKAESVLQGMLEEEGLEGPELKMQLEEDIAKLELLLEEMELIRVVEKTKSPMLEIQLKEHISKVESLLENVNLVREESKVESLALRIELKELEFLLEKLKLDQESGELKFLLMDLELERHIVKLKLLLEETDLENMKERLPRSEMLEMELKNDREKLRFILERKVSPDLGRLNMRWKQCLANETHLLRKIKSVCNETRLMQLKEHTVEFESLLKDMESVKLKAKLKFRKFEMEFHSNTVELEPLLKKLKLQQEEEARLKELAAKSEILLEEIKLKQTGKGHLAKLKEHIAEMSSLPRNIEYKEDDVFFTWNQTATLEALLEEMKMVLRELEFLRWEMELNQRHIKELEFLLKGMKLELQKGLQSQLSQALEMELKELELLVKKIESKRDVEIPESPALKMQLEGHLGHVKLIQEIMMKLKQEKMKLPELKAQLKESIARVYSLAKRIELSLTLGKQLEERIVELESLRRKIKSVPLTEELMETELNRHMTKLESLLIEVNLKQDKEEQSLLKLKLEQHMKKSESLLKEIDSALDVKMLLFLLLKVNSLLKDEIFEEEHMSLTLEIELKRHIAKLEFLIAETKLEQKEEGLGSQMLQMVLEEHIVKSKMERESERDVEMLKSQVSQMQVEKSFAKFRLEASKLERAKREMELPTNTRNTTPVEQKARRRHVASRHIIVIGGRGQEGESLRSVEAYIFLEGRWLGLPAMNTPRSFMSSVVVDQEVIVSGGDTGDAITDTIEVLNFAETPLQWRISPAKLPVPLSAHQTVAYRRKLIVIGGHDGNEGRNSDKIYEVLLSPPYTTTTLSLLPQPRA